MKWISPEDAAGNARSARSVEQGKYGSPESTLRAVMDARELWLFAAIGALTWLLAKTPGQIAYETYLEHIGFRWSVPWESLPPWAQEGWRKTAAAARAAQ